MFAREPFLLHLLAGSDTVTALDAAKALLDAGTHDANEREPSDNLAPLHVAAAWGNIAMCQLLIHYGADVKAEDIDKRRPVDVAEGQCRHFLKRLGQKRRTERSKFGKVLSFLFRCAHPATTNNNNNLSSPLVAPYALPNGGRRHLRDSCSPIVPDGSKHRIKKISNVRQSLHLSSFSRATTAPLIKKTRGGGGGTTETSVLPPLLCQQPKAATGQRPMPSAPPATPPTPRRSSSLAREAFLTDDNTQTTDDDELNMARLEETRRRRTTQTNDHVAEEEQEWEQYYDREALDNDGQADDDNHGDAGDEHNEAFVALRHQFSALRLDELRERLRRRNCIAGPMSVGNRRIYESKLARLETRQHHRQQQGEHHEQMVVGDDDPNAINRYSQSLRRIVRFVEERANAADSQRIGRAEEAQIREEYAHSQPTKKEVSFFCYLLIDPSQLPPPSSVGGHFIGSDVPFRRFVAAIFYVGKGKRSRPLQHLVQASKCRDFATAKPSEQSEKLRRILTLWDRGEGVISQQLFCNIHSAEAHVREGAMIEAIGVDNLTNVVRGSFPGLAAQWSRKQITDFGAFLLREAHTIFQHERCRPIRETDLED